MINGEGIIAMMGGTIGLAVMVALMILALVLAVLWTILPFAIFGIKKRLNEANACWPTSGRRCIR